MNEELLKRVGDKIFPCLGFSPTELLWQRLARVVQQEAGRAGAASVEEFLQRALRGEQAVLEAICQGLTINETYFFREPKHFDALGQLLPELAQLQQPLRILSAGCSSGEEPYSLAMTAQDVLGPRGLAFEVLGIDIDSQALERARRGCYRQWSFRDQGMERARSHVEQRGELWCVREAIRQRVRFEQVNLIERVPPGPFAVIFCRNTLMYFTSEHRAAIVRQFTETLLPGGILVIGSAETLEKPPAELERVSVAGAYLYRKREPVVSRAADPAERTRVLLVSRTPVSRVAIRQALRLLPAIELIGEVRSIEEVRGRLEENGTAVVLLDALEDQAVIERLAVLEERPVVIVTRPGHPHLRGVPVVVVPELVPGALRRVAPEIGEAVQVARQRFSSRSRAATPARPGTGFFGRQTTVPTGALAANGRQGALPRGEPLRRPAERFLLIGSSTGGPAVVTDLVAALPAGLGLGILVVQHMPPNFTRSFAERLARIGQYAAREAVDGELLCADTLLVAPGGHNLLLTRAGRVQVVPPEPGDIYVPNVNRAFVSAARAGLGQRVMAVVLTGMGDDGAIGMAELAAAGAYTVVQRPEEAVVAGMIEAALARGGVQKVLPTADIPSEVVQWAQRGAAVRG
ncbi:transcriptional regulator [Thermomicrobium sp. 4228-Ro]|uniref:chemotaxis protein CheB n=1 Tax=Thermomicrobium sp. 4228-Ro TaxID=2993937 RepID=UPI00224909E4|nr:chemotaxis protein CheB [Thermomicrobium sp. 4228-Ro]MCX2728211.1 transcriptional regulator [Thermomicrobium sp. 4228-Ro]